jgi:hypothetical protein
MVPGHGRGRAARLRRCWRYLRRRRAARLRGAGGAGSGARGSARGARWAAGARGSNRVSGGGVGFSRCTAWRPAVSVWRPAGRAVGSHCWALRPGDLGLACGPRAASFGGWAQRGPRKPASRAASSRCNRVMSCQEAGGGAGVARPGGLARLGWWRPCSCRGLRHRVGGGARAQDLAGPAGALVKLFDHPVGAGGARARGCRGLVELLFRPWGGLWVGS